MNCEWHVRTHIHTHFCHLYVQHVRKYMYVYMYSISIGFQMAMLSEPSREEIIADPLHQNCLGCKQHPTPLDNIGLKLWTERCRYEGQCV